MAKVFLFCLFLFFFLFTPPSVFSSNLLLNPSFEEVTGDLPTNWVKNVSTMTLSLFSPGAEGIRAVSINKVNNTSGTIYTYQDVDVEPEAYYTLSGKVQKNSANFSYALLRISWRGTSGEVSKTDSSQLTQNSSEFTTLSIDAVQAPLSAIKARIELLANIISPNPSSPILFDMISFTQIPAPEQPTIVITPIPTVSPTLTPTPSKSPTSTKTPTFTLSKTPTPTVLLKSPSPLPTISLFLTPTATVSPSFIPESEILGLATDTPPTPTIIVEQLQYEENISSLPAVFLMGAGGFLLLFCAILLYRTYRAQKG